jgi:hypothetical protein
VRLLAISVPPPSGFPPDLSSLQIERASIRTRLAVAMGLSNAQVIGLGLLNLYQRHQALDAVISRCSGRDEPDCAILDTLDIGRRVPSALS